MFIRKIALAVGCATLALGCAGRSDDNEEIVDNLVRAGFPADDIQTVNGVVYVGRDAEVTLVASRELLEGSGAHEEQYRTANVISTSLSKICIDGSTFTGAFSTALDLAIQNYDELPLSFAMARTPSTGCSFTIQAVIQAGAAGGVSGFPSGGLPFGTINIFDGLSTFSVDTIAHVITHEIGHTIGFRHSDFFDRSISCGGAPSNEGDGGVGAILIPGTPSGATVGGSIMNSCFRATETGEFTATDLTALTAMYGRCDPNKPFGTPTLVANVNSSVRDQDAVLVDDLTLIFGSDRSGITDLYMATRASSTSPFGAAVLLPNINTPTASESSPYLTDDGLTMYYTFLPAGATFEDIYVTTRTAKTSAFPVGAPVPGVNSTSADADPFITPDNTALYFGSARGSTQLDLYVALRQANGSFSPPQPLTALNTSTTDGHPRLTQGGLRIYWSSNRTDGGAQGGTDIWTATRASAAASFATPTRVSELSTASNESPSWISPDGCTMYLQSDRPGGSGAQDIYVATKPK